MKTPRIANAIGHIDDDLAAGAAECKKNRNYWLNWRSLAVCFARDRFKFCVNSKN